MIKLMLITNDVNLAADASKKGVQRIFVDLERNGKHERQGHRDTLISDHSFEDAEAIRNKARDTELLIRLNPFYTGSEKEIERAISVGADLIMLPMFKEMGEILFFCEKINGRSKFIPLVETPEAVKLIPELINESRVDEIYIGLNDLHMALDMDFMFELVANGTIPKIAEQCLTAKKPFGFGGVATMEEGLLPGRLVLAEHIRLGSNAVILSRAFHQGLERDGFLQEVEKLRHEETLLRNRTTKEIQEDHEAFLAGVTMIANKIADKKSID